MYKETDFKKIEINTDPPLTEPERQYYYIALCRELVRREAERLLSGRIKAHENFILASVTGNYGQDITSFFKYAVFVDVARKIRLQRVRSRSFEKFGDRILPGGDLYEQEERFFDFAASRNEKLVEEWIRSLSCPVIRVDGTKPVEENAELLKASFRAAVGLGSVCLP